jgi:hypothetical protein
MAVHGGPEQDMPSVPGEENQVQQIKGVSEEGYQGTCQRTHQGTSVEGKGEGNRYMTVLYHLFSC